MASFRVYNVPCYEPQTEAIHCMTYSKRLHKLALSRSGGQIEIWNVAMNNLFQEKIIPPQPGQSIESLVWCSDRLFSVGFSSIIIEYDLLNLKAKRSTPTSFGPCWCMAANNAETYLAVGTQNGHILLYEMADSSLDYFKSLDKQEGKIVCLSWHETGDYIATGSSKAVRFWDVKAGNTEWKINVCTTKSTEENIVWCIKLNADFQIICGDSTGKISIIDAKQGSLLQNFKSHKGPILCLAVDLLGDVFYASGVDPLVMRFERRSNGHWVKAMPLHPHTHDVRAMACTDDYVISGGVDANVAMTQSTPKLTMMFPPFPHQSCVQVAKKANFMILQYSTYVELWNLGSTTNNSSVDGQRLTMSSNSRKLIQIKAAGSQVMVCSSISEDGQWLSYATNKSLRVFQVQLQLDEAEIIDVTLHRVRCLTKECGPSLRLKFAPDASRLYSMLPNGTIQVLGLDSVQLSFLHEIEAKESFKGCHLFNVSPNGNYIALGCHSGDVIVYETKEFQMHSTLPTIMNSQPTALAFSPESNELVTTYENGKIVAYDLTIKEYSNWCTDLHVTNVKCFNQMPLIVRGITWSKSCPKHIIFHSLRKIHFINRELLRQQKKMSKRRHKEIFKRSDRYQHLLHFESLKDDFMVAVVVSPKAVLDRLPAQLKKKIYGT